MIYCKINSIILLSDKLVRWQCKFAGGNLIKYEVVERYVSTLNKNRISTHYLP